MTQAPFTIGIIQMAMQAGPDANVKRAEGLLREAKAKGVQVACLPELFRSYYFCQSENHDYFDLAEPIPGPTSTRMQALAKELGMVIVASLFERRCAGMYHNTTVVFDADGTDLGMYRKMHIPDDPRYYEKFYFTPGDLGFKNFDTKFGRIGVLICWDQWFPEAARLTAMQGASVIFYPTAIGWHPAEKAEYGDEQWNKWQTVQRGHAVANNVFVASPNRVGLEPETDNGALEFFGHSFICDTSGRYIQHADEKFEGVLTAVVDPKKVEKQRQYWPYFRDRRIDAYGGLLEHPAVSS
ncbi:MAG: carbon-nitrogen hydrolase [Rickettsiales bacterium]